MKKKWSLLLGIMMLVNISCTNNNIIKEEKVVVTNENEINILKTYTNEIPKNISFLEKYKGGHPELLEYIFIRTLTANLREKPNTNSEILEVINFNIKVKLIEKVENKGIEWYKVESENKKIGYIYSKVALTRIFRFEDSLNKIKEAENFIKDSREKGYELAVVNSYSPNPNNVERPRAKERDKYGTSFDQNISGFSGEEEIFIPDRSILAIKEIKKDDKLTVAVASIKEELIVKKNRIKKMENLSKQPINKAIAIDVKNQNMIIYEKILGEWNIISYVWSKTGMESQVGFETPKGIFLAAVSKYEMLYNSEVGDRQGLAKYATRFSGGGYIHGTPLNYDEEINKEYFLEQKEMTLGTLTGTRKCVRTSEPHAKFLFDWGLNGKPNQNKNDQHIEDNILVVSI
ncbi:MAG: L,D-transpeptidase family protein [Fusobacteriaceae bacterium]